MKKLFTILLAATTITATAQLKPVGYNDGAQKLHGFSVKPARTTASKAGILILPAWMGIDTHAKNTAQKLAAADIFHLLQIFMEKEIILLTLKKRVSFPVIIKRIFSSTISAYNWHLIN